MNETKSQNLNQNQLEAVFSKEKAIYLHAGAGTGKTTTLTRRILYLINDLNIKAENILAITFTNNAAQEMKERLKKNVDPKNFDNLTISTFHSLGYQILRKNISKLNLDLGNNLYIADESKSQSVIKDIIKKLNLDKERFKYSRLKKNFAKIKNNEVKKKILNELEQKMQNEEWFTPYDDYTYDNLSSEEKQIFNLYKEFLKKNNLLDFNDLLIYSYQLLQKDKSITSFYNEKFKYILIDEFQDIDLIQYNIIKLIGKNNFIFVVGDPNQNIYSFRGANILCNELFIRDFKAHKINLNFNYRSTQNILDKANLLIQNNHNPKDKSFQNVLKNNSFIGEPVIYKHFINENQEAEFISETIKKLISKHHYNYHDIIILYRMNQLYKHIENIFITKNIPYIAQNVTSLYQQTVVKDFVSYLKVLMDPNNDIDLKRIINVPSRKIGIKTINKLEQMANEKNISLFQAMQNLSDDDNIKPKINNFLNLFYDLQKIFSDENQCNLDNVIKLINEKINYSELLSQKTNNKDSNSQKDKIIDRLNNLQKIFSIENEEQKTGSFLEKLNILLNKISLSSNENQTEQSNKVLLSSIHKAKGLEFKIVFAIGWEQNIFFNSDENKKKNVEKEERRIAYVAITRAKELLYITSVKNRFLKGKHIINEPICFLKEMKLFSDNSFTNKNHKFNQYQTKKNNIYQDGDRVQHNKFGQGIVISATNDLLTISFKLPHKIKQILITHPSLTKIK
ncbi:ATP-dependent DNA helicase [Candidatus Phytoplasma luffae]|uniref:DNA 3'-5' helicase n=1 Tax=Loofah witches'-broom phytoplasma TaxID=35773 RepID=A0A975FL59_LOWBP|nr:ATP-dependent helicase [Candidatus Phytoplasma luffae]QTX02915.1 ATP-dependent DNA helicase [Candidatus Phytoplasma luffae]QTX02986.1 ATP-dependent DNA helicase [Candidatus Phytoplasma luffae]